MSLPHEGAPEAVKGRHLKHELIALGIRGDVADKLRARALGERRAERHVALAQTTLMRGGQRDGPGLRKRGQVELVFKRLKSLAHLSHLPKSDARSARAWLYGKLFVALLTEQVMRQGRTLSPGTAECRAAGTARPLARVRVRVASASTGSGACALLAGGYGRLARHR